MSSDLEPYRRQGFGADLQPLPPYGPQQVRLLEFRFDRIRPQRDNPMAKARLAETLVPKRGRIGRPEGASGNVRETMLDAAEQTFADLGYAGTTLREVSKKASVTQALISYYFGSKFGLFEEVFLRRGRKISDARLDKLSALLRQPAPPSVRDIVLAFRAARDFLPVAQ